MAFLLAETLLSVYAPSSMDRTPFNIAFSARMFDPFLYLCMKIADQQEGVLRSHCIRLGVRLFSLDIALHLFTTPCLTCLRYMDQWRVQRKKGIAPKKILGKKEKMQKLFCKAYSKTCSTFARDRIWKRHFRSMLTSQQDELLRLYWCTREARMRVRQKKEKNFFVTLPDYQPQSTANLSREEKIHCIVEHTFPKEARIRQDMEALFAEEKKDSDFSTFPI